MFVLSNFISALARVIDLLLHFYMWLILIRAVVSWLSPDPNNPIVQFLYRVTEPVLEPVRRLVPTWRIGIDLSPLIVFLVIVFLRQFVVDTLAELAARMQ
jgi:YggT family protein